ncbi:unnamed protein product [Gulo gulo]|uniref:Uncharacterized protein n=1 Tax=Gulo gulo TaxID=48420 RepID=A0A9X9LDE4_GULGU|nr:unnamed protein product [Gulo gulo]
MVFSTKKFISGRSSGKMSFCKDVPFSQWRSLSIPPQLPSE